MCILYCTHCVVYIYICIYIIVFFGHFDIPDNVYTLYTVVEAVDFHRNKNRHIVIENSTVRLVELFL